jgi:hypothetical protein
MCKGVRGLKCSISSPVVSTQKKMSRRKGLQGYSAGRIPYPFTNFTCKLSNTNRNQFLRIDSHGPECKCSICLVMLFHMFLKVPG